MKMKTQLNTSLIQQVKFVLNKITIWGGRRDAYRVLVGKPEGKSPFGRSRRRWEDNIMMDRQEVGCEGRDWIDLAQDRDKWRTLVNAVMNLRVS
jgi:hypothetical protein